MLCGDVNLDGVIDLIDMVLVQKHLVGSSGFTLQGICMDVNHDGFINALDVTLYQRHILGIELIKQKNHTVLLLTDLLSWFLSILSQVVAWMIANPFILIPIFIFFLAHGALSTVQKGAGK